MLTDVRGHEDLFTLDKDGFEWLRHTPNVLEPSSNVKMYMQEMFKFLLEFCHCQEVFIYDYVKRSPSPTDRKSGFSNVTRRVHCGKSIAQSFNQVAFTEDLESELDQSPRSAIGRIKLHTGDRAQDLLQKRCRIFSVWRPLFPIIEAYPLMACSYTTTDPSELIPLDVVYPHYAEESFEIRYSLLHKWYYKSAMTPDDLMIIKLFDNKIEDDTAFYAPHGSWRDPNARKDAPPRRSIELRCIVFG